MDLYEKRGKRYYKAAEWVKMDSFPLGSHLVQVDKGSTMRLFKIAPARAEILAAVHEVRHEVAQEISQSVKASRAAGWTDRDWKRFQKEFPTGLRVLTIPCALDVVDALVRAIVERMEAGK